MLLIIVGIFFSIPIILYFSGVYDVDEFLRRPPSAILTSLHCDYDVKDNDGYSCMRVTSVVSTHNMVGKDIKIQAKFMHKDGTPVLSDIDNTPIVVTEQVEVKNDDPLSIVLPVRYNVFSDKSWENMIECHIYLSYPDWNNNVTSYRQNMYWKVGVPIKTAYIKNVNINHNVIQDGKKGMKVTVEYVSKNLKGETLYCMVRFYNNDGSPLVHQSKNKKYRSMNGNVIVGDYNLPTYDDCKSEAMLFVPYDEFNAKGGKRMDLTLDASILYYTSDTDYKVLDKSRTYSFYVI